MDIDELLYIIKNPIGIKHELLNKLKCMEYNKDLETNCIERELQRRIGEVCLVQDSVLLLHPPHSAIIFERFIMPALTNTPPIISSNPKNNLLKSLNLLCSLVNQSTNAIEYYHRWRFEIESIERKLKIKGSKHYLHP